VLDTSHARISRISDLHGENVSQSGEYVTPVVYTIYVTTLTCRLPNCLAPFFHAKWHCGRTHVRSRDGRGQPSTQVTASRRQRKPLKQCHLAWSESANLRGRRQHVVFVSVWVDPAAEDETAVRGSARDAVSAAISEAVRGRDSREVAALVESRENLRHPFYGGA